MWDWCRFCQLFLTKIFSLPNMIFRTSKGTRQAYFVLIPPPSMLILVRQCIFHEEWTFFLGMLLQVITLNTEALLEAILVNACGTRPELARVLQILIKTITENPGLTFTTETKQILYCSKYVEILSTCSVSPLWECLLCGSGLVLQREYLQDTLREAGPSSHLQLHYLNF